MSPSCNTYRIIFDLPSIDSMIMACPEPFCQTGKPLNVHQIQALLPQDAEGRMPLSIVKHSISHNNPSEIA